MGRFTGQVAVVTGAASGLGLATARRLADEGATVQLLDRDPEAVREAAAGLPGCTAHEVDVTDPPWTAATTRPDGGAP